MYQSITLAAGVAVEFQEPADFFRVLSSVPSDLDIIFYRNGAEQSAASNIGAGYAEDFEAPITKLRISSAAGGLVRFVMRLGNRVRYDAPPTGNVSVTNTAGAFTQDQKTVTNASAQLLAANAARRYLLIQNNDTAGIMYVTLDGTAATTAKGIKIDPGGVLELNGYSTTAAIFAIGSIASNANVVAVEG